MPRTKDLGLQWLQLGPRCQHHGLELQEFDLPGDLRGSQASRQNYVETMSFNHLLGR